MAYSICVGLEAAVLLMWVVLMDLVYFPGLPADFPRVLLLFLLSFSLFLSCRRGRGKYDFFAGCDAIETYPPPLDIVFGRPVAAGLRRGLAALSQPLIRGESRYIIGTRASLICALCCAIPGFATYVVILVPITAHATTRSIRCSQSWHPSDDVGDWVKDNITLIILYDSGPDLVMANVTVGTMDQICSTNTVYSAAWNPGSNIPVACPFPWTDVPPSGLTVSANFSDPWGILYVKPGQADPSDVNEYTEPIPLVAGSHLAAILGATQRRVLSRSGLDFSGFFGARDVIVKPVLLIQEDPMQKEPSSHTVQLRLRSRRDIISATRIVEDYTDASVLSGLASLGGFWAFINGAIALFFGADLLYFVFRMRPLSPLGLVHQLQRRSLMQKWNADFPAMYTEGGHPGSDTAGVVAFIRERLVDIDTPSPTDPEAQIQTTTPALNESNDRGIDAERVSNSEDEEKSISALETVGTTYGVGE
ncbi:hypothetical protein C8R43DRAFT_1040290 [Mycena crocata]|nr:hypothetical protein C8R43DRAFT_1040290 [Mycena crocata]